MSRASWSFLDYLFPNSILISMLFATDGAVRISIDPPPNVAVWFEPTSVVELHQTGNFVGRSTQYRLSYSAAAYIYILNAKEQGFKKLMQLQMYENDKYLLFSLDRSWSIQTHFFLNYIESKFVSCVFFWILVFLHLSEIVFIPDFFIFIRKQDTSVLQK